MFEQSEFINFSRFNCFLGAWAAVLASFSAVRKAEKILTNQKKKTIIKEQQKKNRRIL